MAKVHPDNSTLLALDSVSATARSFDADDVAGVHGHLSSCPQVLRRAIRSYQSILAELARLPSLKTWRGEWPSTLRENRSGHRSQKLNLPSDAITTPMLARSP